MSAGTYNTIIDQGADWFLNIVYENPNGTPINITNYSAALQVRTSPLAKTSVLTLTTQNGGLVITGALGKIAAHATAAQTSTITNGKYAYDLEITAPISNVVTRLIQGTIQVSPQVTRT